MANLSEQQISEIAELVRKGQKIAAIKLYREWAGVDLKAAKDAIEAVSRLSPGVPGEIGSTGAQQSSPVKSIVSWLVFILLAGGMFFYISNRGTPTEERSAPPAQLPASPKPPTTQVALASGPKLRTSPITHALQAANPKLAEQLIAQGADVNEVSTDNAKETPLLAAAGLAKDRGLNLVIKLVEKGANVNSQQAGGYTALMRAVRLRSPKTVKYLLSHGADVNTITPKHETAVDWARQVNEQELIDLVTQAGGKSGDELTGGGAK